MDKACACQELARPVYVSGASGNYTEADLRQAMSRLAMRALEYDGSVQAGLALCTVREFLFSFGSKSEEEKAYRSSGYLQTEIL